MKLQRCDFHGRQNLIEITQNTHTTRTTYGDVRSHTQRSSRNWELFIALKRITFGQELLMKSINSKEMFDMPIISTAQRKLPIVPGEIPSHAWHTLGTDLFYWKHSDYLVLGDYFSKYLIVRKLPSSTWSAVCKEILNIVTELGKPYIIRSDNGPCYTSTEFKELMKLLQIQHITSSPHFPQSNGFAEAMVKIAKKLMDHSTLQEKHWNFGLIEYRCTPLRANIPSPLELLTGCKPKQMYHLCHEIFQSTENIMKLLSRNSRKTFQMNSLFRLMNQDKQYGASIP